jgi:SPP1 family holin
MKDGISTGTIIRTIILALALFNQVMTASGHPIINISDETITQVVTALATIITAVIAWWKNNSFTSEAIQADEYMHQLKDTK